MVYFGMSAEADILASGRLGQQLDVYLPQREAERAGQQTIDLIRAKNLRELTVLTTHCLHRSRLRIENRHA